jgi:WD40 repeat protein
VLALAVVLGVLVAGAGLAAHQGPSAKDEAEDDGEAPPATARRERVRPEGETQVHSDLYGDPLPPGALVRMGTVRLRHYYAAVAFAAEGKIVVSAGGNTGDLTIRFWEPATGKQTRRIELGVGPDSARAVAADGKTVAVVADEVLHLWEAATGKELRRIQVPPGRGYFNIVTLSPDGRAVATASYNQEGNFLDVWDTATGRELCHLAQGDGVGDLAFSCDGKTLATATTVTDALRLWDTTTGKELRRLPVKATGVAFSPDGRLLASAVLDGTVTLWEVATGKELATFREPAAGQLCEVAFSPDGSVLAVVGVKHTVLRDVATRNALRTLPGLLSRRLTFAPDGKTLAGSGMGTIRLWDVATGKPLHSWPGHDSPPDALAFSPGGRVVASLAAPEHGPRLWDAGTGKALHFLEGHESSARCAGFSADGKLALSGGDDGTVRLWEAATGTELRKFVIEALGDGPQRPRVKAVRLSADGRRLAALSVSPAAFPRDNCQLDVWDTATGRLLTHRAFPGDWNPGFTPEGKAAAGWDRKDRFFIQDMSTGQELGAFAGDPSYPVILSPDETLLVAASDADGGSPIAHAAPGKESPRMTGVGFSDVATRVLLFRIDTGPAALLALSPDGRVLAAAGADVLRFWEVASGKEILRIRWPGGFRGSPSDSFVKCLAFTPDGRALATGHEDSTVVVWDIAPGLRRAEAVKELSPTELDQAWGDLAAEDAGKAYRAVWALVAAPAQAAPFLTDHLPPERPPDPNRLRRLLADLDSEEFTVRNTAATELAGLGGDAAPALRKALEASPSAEVRRRLEGLLADALLAGRRPVNSPETLRALRAVHVLEQVGTANAREGLEALARGAPGARLTREAKASLDRLAGRVAAIP